jgi:hypothetical protein
MDFKIKGAKFYLNDEKVKPWEKRIQWVSDKYSDIDLDSDKSFLYIAEENESKIILICYCINNKDKIIGKSIMGEYTFELFISFMMKYLSEDSDWPDNIKSPWEICEDRIVNETKGTHLLTKNVSHSLGNWYETNIFIELLDDNKFRIYERIQSAALTELDLSGECTFSSVNELTEPFELESGHFIKDEKGNFKFIEYENDYKSLLDPDVFIEALKDSKYEFLISDLESYQDQNKI